MSLGPGDETSTVGIQAPPRAGLAGRGEGPDRPSAVILNVNDDDANRDLVSRTLREAGLTVQEAATGREALRLVAAWPDLVILDVDLPDLDGFEVCRRIKADPDLALIPVLHLFAKFVRVEDRVHGLEGGADGYLVQPFEPPELVATVRSLLRLRDAERAAEAATRQWQATFEAIGDGVCLTDRDGRVVRCNPAFGTLLGMRPDELVGRPLAELLEGWTGRPAGELLAPTPDSRASVELRVGDRWLRARSDPVADAGGAGGGSVYSLVDLTDRRRAEAAEANAARNADRVRHLERELQQLERLGIPPSAAPGEAIPLNHADPVVFADAVRRYGELMELALEQRRYKVTNDLSGGLRGLGEWLGQNRAGPRDAIEIHNAALLAKRPGAASARVQAYIEEGRLLLLELMGNLVGYYRRLAPASVSPWAQRHPGPQGGDGVAHG